MLDLLNTITDRIFGIILAVVGLMMLFAPYEKVKEVFHKTPSKKMVKIVGAILTIGGILTAIGIL